MTGPDPSQAPIGAASVFVEVHERLKAMASRQLAGRERGTLDTTAVVHELYLRMGSKQTLSFQAQQQIFRLRCACDASLLADRARNRLRQRAGGYRACVTLDGNEDKLATASADQALQLEAGWPIWNMWIRALPAWSNFAVSPACHLNRSPTPSD